MAAFLVFAVITFLVILGGLYLSGVIIGLVIMAASIIYGLLVLSGAGLVLCFVIYILTCIFS